MAEKMKKNYGDKLDLHIYTSDSEEAKPYSFRSATNVLVNKKIIQIDIATDEKAMEKFLKEKV